jgi:hypothetical protein
MSSADRSIVIRNVLIGLVALAIPVVLSLMWWKGRGDAAASLASPEVAAERSETFPPAPPEPRAESERVAEAGARRWREVTGQDPVWPEPLSEPASCEEVRADLARICVALDVRTPELRDHGGACTLIEQLGAELAASPPDLAPELRDYDTLVKNVFHLFRIAGRERMQVMRRALSEEDLVEPAALALYRWAVSHERCTRGDGPKLRKAVLYAYAGFAFNTLGGQAYLRRRSPRVESLACFYGLSALDGVIRAGHNPEGLDPRREIPRCRELAASQPLVFSERYTAELDAMARRWKARGPR